jgi:triacylglycerol esterase/lipase EstA (alpha/beta hydrolase family)
LRSGRWWLIAVLVLALVESVAVGSGPAASAGTDPPLDVPIATLAAAVRCPAFHHAQHEPVLLVHGTGIDPAESWSWNYEKALPAVGFDACTVALPDRALGDIQVASEYVAYAIERIHSVTGRRVEVITHSQGGMEGRWVMRWWPGARRDTDDLIDLSSPNHGIVGADLCADSGNCWPAVWQMGSHSKFVHALNSESETPGSVSYTQLYSLTDELVEPSSTVPLSDGSNAANVAVQAVCPGRVVHHVGMLEDAIVFDLVLDAMSHPGPTRASAVPMASCLQTLAPAVTPADAISGNAVLYTSAAIAFFQHPGTTAEPPLKPYANAA